MVATKNMKYPDKELYEYVLLELEKRNIITKTVGEAVYEMQHKYFPDITVEEFGAELPSVLKKREVLNILALGFAIDELVTKKQFPEPMQTIIANDLGIFGCDEVFGLSIAKLFGTLAETNYGALDKNKVGLAAELDNSGTVVNTFADDLFLALVAAVIGRFGHGSALKLD